MDGRIACRAGSGHVAVPHCAGCKSGRNCAWWQPRWPVVWNHRFSVHGLRGNAGGTPADSHSAAGECRVLDARAPLAGQPECTAVALSCRISGGGAAGTAVVAQLLCCGSERCVRIDSATDAARIAGDDGSARDRVGPSIPCRSTYVDCRYPCS